MISVHSFSDNWFQIFILSFFLSLSLLVLPVKTKNTWQLSWWYKCKDSMMSHCTLCEDRKEKWLSQAFGEKKKKDNIYFLQNFKYHSLWNAEQSSDLTPVRTNTLRRGGKYDIRFSGFDFTEAQLKSCSWNRIQIECHFGKCPKKKLEDLEKLKRFLRLISDTLLTLHPHYLKPDRRWMMSS